MKTARFWASVLLSLALLMLAIGVAYAYVITVDGDGGDWLPSSSVQTDGDESEISNGWDFKEIFNTTDKTYMYWRFDSYGNSDWSDVGPVHRYVYICMNTDNNTGTGSQIGVCNNLEGVDRIIYIRGPKSGNSLTIALYDGSWGTISATNALAANQGAVNEVRAQLSDLGIVENCGTSYNMPTALYWDNQMQDPDDRTPNTSSFNTTINCPTAATLSSMSASANTSVPTLPFALAGLLGAGALGLFIVGRRR